MAFRFQKRIKIAPGVRLNLSKSTASITAGMKGASVNIGKNGKYLNLGLPGTGLSTRTRIDSKKGRAAQADSAGDTPEKPGILATLAAFAFLGFLGLVIWWVLQ